MGDVKEFDPNLYHVTFAALPMSGYTEDSMIEIEEDGPAFTYKKGLDGAITRSKNLAQTAKITIHLMSSSRSNADLSLIHAADKAKDGGAGIAPVFLKDDNGASLFAHDKSWIEQMPKVSRGKEADDNPWPIRVASGYIFVEAGSS